MTPVAVADASVIVKWLLPEKERGSDSDLALSLLASVREGALALLQPPHWLAEVAAVLTRISPQTAEADVADLFAMQLPVSDTAEVFLTGCRLARTLDHHLFDTLYHAVALETQGALLVTADARYFRKASGQGAIAMLADLPRTSLLRAP